MYGKEQVNSMVLELNASDTRGIDDIRDQVVTFASTRNLFSKSMKLVILDEADNMTRDAQFALRRVIEKYTFNTRFCMICNYVSKIIPALQSRCTRFRFSPLAPEQVRGRVQEICRAEEIECTEDGMTALLRLSRGDMRKVLNLLEASAMQRTEMDEEGLRKKPIVDARLVYQVAGKPTPEDVDMIMDALWNHSLQECFDVVGAMQVEKGLALTDVVSELHDRVRTMNAHPAVLKHVLKELAECEFRLATAVDDKIQLLGLIAIFVQARRIIAEGMA
jgi:replication factor C subunit 3/5